MLLKFFDSHFPSRIIYLALLFGSGLLILLLFFPNEGSNNILLWSIVGSKLSSGNVMYRDIWASTAPLFSWCIAPVIGLFGKGATSFQLLGGILILIQALYFGFILNDYKILKTRSYVPSLLYLTFSFIHFETLALSPELVGATFPLIALRVILSMNSKESYGSSTFNTGLLLGLAILFSPIYFWLIFIFFMGMSFFSTISLKNALLTLLGFIVPMVIYGVYMIYVDGFEQFLTFYVYNFFSIRGQELLNRNVVLRVLAIPAIFLILGLLKSLVTSSGSNFHGKVDRLMFIWLICGVILLGLNYDQFNLAHIHILLIPFAYYTSIFFTGWKRKANFSELLFILFIAAIATTGQFYTQQVYYSSQHNASLETYKSQVDDEPIFFLEGNISDYRGAVMGTAFVEPAYLKSMLESLKDKELNRIYYGFTIDPPTVIIDDDENTFALVLERIPILREKYFRQNPGVYKLKKY